MIDFLSNHGWLHGSSWHGYKYMCHVVLERGLRYLGVEGVHTSRHRRQQRLHQLNAWMQLKPGIRPQNCCHMHRLQLQCQLLYALLQVHGRMLRCLQESNVQVHAGGCQHLFRRESASPKTHVANLIASRIKCAPVGAVLFGPVQSCHLFLCGGMLWVDIRDLIFDPRGCRRTHRVARQKWRHHIQLAARPQHLSDVVAIHAVTGPRLPAQQLDDRDAIYRQLVQAGYGPCSCG